MRTSNLYLASQNIWLCLHCVVGIFFQYLVSKKKDLLQLCYFYDMFSSLYLGIHFY